MYLSIKKKLVAASVLAFAWFTLSYSIAIPWINDLTSQFGPVLAWAIVIGLALIPGLANMFLITGLLFDKRPQYENLEEYPPISVMVAAYNEEDNIEATIRSIMNNGYPGPVQIIPIDDGSTDETAAVIKSIKIDAVTPVDITITPVLLLPNQGKAAALNSGLNAVQNDLVVTVDADTLLYKDALKNIVTNIVNEPKKEAVAGTVLVRNSRHGVMTHLQEWDYFHGIAVVKRIQSMFGGTLVAQGAFSIYRTEILRELGGWQNTVGEDIVLTWGIRDKDGRVGYAENALVFTNVPETYKQFFKQRMRWARGLIEAFKTYPKTITNVKMNSPFIWLNLCFPFLDLVYIVAFIPGLIAAVFFQNYTVVGIMTLFLVPAALLMNAIMFMKQRAIFKAQGLRVRENVLGFIIYMFGYQMIMVPASMSGYIAEFLNLRKGWGTK